MFARARRAIRLLLTSLVVLAAILAVIGLWQHYMVSPWTRDGQVRAQVANIAPQVAGQIVELHVHDDQFVHKGDLLYVIDKSDYKVALAAADADVASKGADLEVKKNQAARREALTTLSTSIEEKQRYAGDYSVAQAAYQTALVNRDKANLNLGRTDVRATVNGYVTNLLLRVGDYANTGASNIAVVDSDSFWVSRLFRGDEARQLHHRRPGARRADRLRSADLGTRGERCARHLDRERDDERTRAADGAGRLYLGAARPAHPRPHPHRRRARQGHPGRRADGDGHRHAGRHRPAQSLVDAVALIIAARAPAAWRHRPPAYRP